MLPLLRRVLDWISRLLCPVPNDVTLQAFMVQNFQYLVLHSRISRLLLINEHLKVAVCELTEVSGIASYINGGAF